MTEWSTNKIRIHDIMRGTSADGPGLRTSIYCAGCFHHCQGCHNPQTWDPLSGYEITLGELYQIIIDEELNVTLTGGDPMYNPENFALLARKIKETTDLNIWCYTGFTFEELIKSPSRMALVALCDVIVDGPFILEQKKSSLLFRGSCNQRLIDVRRTLSAGRIILYTPDTLLNLD